MTPQTLQLNNPIVSTLKAPDGQERKETVSELTFRAPTARDMLVLDNVPGEVARGIALIAVLTGLTERQIGNMAADDFVRAGAVIAGFMPSGLLTGGTS